MRLLVYAILLMLALDWLEFNTAALVAAIVTMAVGAALFAEAQRPGA